MLVPLLQIEKQIRRAKRTGRGSPSLYGTAGIAPQGLNWARSPSASLTNTLPPGEA